MSDLSIKRLFKFPPNRLGYLAQYVEPVSANLEEDYLRNQFSQDTGLQAIPVESDGGVSGLVTREALLHGEHKKMSFRQRSAGDLQASGIPIYDAMESISTTVKKILDTGYQGEFLIYHGGRYLGVASGRDVLVHSARLQADDLEQAKRVQDNFMFIAPETDPRLGFHWFNQMAYDVGGDFIQWRRIDNDLWFLGLFDLAGKGVSAALSTSLVSAYFTTLDLTGALRHERPARIITMLHQLMQRTLIDDSFVACAFVFFDLRDQSIRMYNCGLGPIFAYLHTADGRTRHVKIDPNLPPLGFEGFPEDKLVAARLKWVPGIKLFLSTDGLSDMKNPEGRVFGEDQVEAFINNRERESGAELRNHTVDLVKQWIGNAPQADDVTFAVVEWPLGSDSALPRDSEATLKADQAE